MFDGNQTLLNTIQQSFIVLHKHVTSFNRAGTQQCWTASREDEGARELISHIGQALFSL